MMNKTVFAAFAAVSCLGTGAFAATLSPSGLTADCALGSVTTITLVPTTDRISTASSSTSTDLGSLSVMVISSRLAKAVR